MTAGERKIRQIMASYGMDRRAAIDFLLHQNRNRLSREVAGMTADVRDRMPSSTEDAIWDVVQRAIDDGWTKERFRRVVAEAWYHLWEDEEDVTR